MAELEQQESDAPYEGWARLELFGHRKLVGYVRDVQIFGERFCRIDVLGPDGTFVATQRYGGKAVYAITDLTEKAAREMVKPWTPVGYQLGAGGGDETARETDYEPEPDDEW